jgi:hypothetical protein
MKRTTKMVLFAFVGMALDAETSAVPQNITEVLADVRL